MGVTPNVTQRQSTTTTLDIQHFSDSISYRYKVALIQFGTESKHPHRSKTLVMSEDLSTK